MTKFGCDLKYRMWSYVKPEFVVEDRTISPFYLNFNDVSVMINRLHPRVWIVNGLVVQIIHYAKYDSLLKKYSIPVIRERWNWTLDKLDDTVISREITIQGYEDSYDADNLISRKTTNIKYYNTYTDKINELHRRRENIIYDLKDQIIATLVKNNNTSELVTAITNVNVLMNYLSKEINLFISSGDISLTSVFSNDNVNNILTQFPWLTTQIKIYGYKSLPIWKLIEIITVSPTCNILQSFDYQCLDNV